MNEYAVSWRSHYAPIAVVAAVVTVTSVVVVAAREPVGLLALVPFHALVWYLLLWWTAVGARVTRDALVVETAVREVAIPLADVEIASGAGAWYGAVRRRGRLLWWRLPPYLGQRREHLLELVRAAREAATGSSRGTPSSARAAGS